MLLSTFANDLIITSIKAEVYKIKYSPPPPPYYLISITGKNELLLILRCHELALELLWRA